MINSIQNFHYLHWC